MDPGEGVVLRVLVLLLVVDVVMVVMVLQLGGCA
jgi:hypothetical protein